MEAPDTQSETVFRHLVQPNALNWHSKTWVSEVVLAGQSDEGLQTSARQWVDDIHNHKSSSQVDLLVNGEHKAESETGEGKGLVETRRALLLKGSPKTRKSTSYSLGGYQFEQLGGRSIQTETIYLHTELRNSKRWQALLEAVEAADLVRLVFRLYCDSLPTPVTEAFERITTYRQGRDPARRELFSAVAKPLNIEDFPDLIAKIINGEHVWYIA